MLLELGLLSSLLALLSFDDRSNIGRLRPHSNKHGDIAKHFEVGIEWVSPQDPMDKQLCLVVDCELLVELLLWLLSLLAVLVFV